MSVSTSLPKPITAYIAAQNRHDIDAMLLPFTDAAVVKDEGEERHGLVAIRGWMEETTKKYQPKVAVVDAETVDGKHIVTLRVSGTFPGSPLDLRYIFILAGGGKISRLEVLS